MPNDPEYFMGFSSQYWGTSSHALAVLQAKGKSTPLYNATYTL